MIVAICDNDSIHHARKVTAYLSEHPRLELLYGARYSPHDDPVERIWGGLKNYVANTAVSWPARLRQVHAFFRTRSPDQLLATAAPWTLRTELLECRFSTTGQTPRLALIHPKADSYLNGTQSRSGRPASPSTPGHERAEQQAPDRHAIGSSDHGA